MTGNSISIGRSIDQADLGATIFYFTIVFCFMTGSAIGWTAQTPEWRSRGGSERSRGVALGAPNPAILPTPQGASESWRY